MSKEELIKEIDVTAHHNNYLIQWGHKVNFKTKDELQKNNILLEKIEKYLQSENEYERGVEEGMNICRALYNNGPGAYDYNVKPLTLSDKFTYFNAQFLGNIFKEYSNKEIVEKYRLYLSDKKKEEEEKIIVGDVVYHEAWKDNPFVVRYIEDGYIYGIDKDCTTPKFIFPNNCIHKTGKHVDISGFLKDAVEGCEE